MLCGGALALTTLSLASNPAHAAQKSEQSASSSKSASKGSSMSKGKLGVGGLLALSGYRALQVKYFLTPKWSVSGALGLDFFSPSVGSRNIIDVVFAPGVNYWITPKNQSGPITASFGLGGRMGIYLGSGPSSAASRSGVSLEGTVTAEVFLGKHFSLAPEAGMVFRFVNNGPDPAGVGDGFGLELGNNTGLFGGGSFNFYF